MDLTSEIRKLAAESRMDAYGYVEIANLHYYPEIRAICQGNACRNYAASWACPPAIGTIEVCRERIAQYEKMLLFSKTYELEDSFDLEGMVAGLKDFKHVVDVLQQKLDKVLPTYLLLSNEGCGRCQVCTYPDAPCRFPHLLHHSLEGYGLVVKELADAAGIRYRNGPDTVTYFSALLFHSAKSCAAASKTPIR